MKITTELPPDSFHRADFTTCPHCGHGMHTEKWDKVISCFVTGIVQCKHDSGASVSECPKCFQKSWVHVRLNMVDCYDFPKAVIEAAKKELNRRQVSALRNWGSGICWKCANLESGHVTTGTWRNCIAGCGPAETECKKFKQTVGMPLL